MEWEVNATSRPLYPRKRDRVPTEQEPGWTRGPVWTGAENLTPTGVSSPDRPARSESLYQLSYTCPKQTHIGLMNTTKNRKILSRRELWTCITYSRKYQGLLSVRLLYWYHAARQTTKKKRSKGILRKTLFAKLHKEFLIIRLKRFSEIRNYINNLHNIKICIISKLNFLENKTLYDAERQVAKSDHTQLLSAVSYIAHEQQRGSLS